MAEEKEKQASGATVRIWLNPKKRLANVREQRSKKERRPISEAEMVSRAVDMFCDREEKKLGVIV